jgi:hypothetical protein
MRTVALPVLRTLIGLFQSRARLHLEILALRQQLAMVKDQHHYHHQPELLGMVLGVRRPEDDHLSSLKIDLR